MQGQPPLLIKQPESVAKSHLFCDRGVGECCATNLKIEMDQKCMFNELLLMQMQTHVVTFVHVGPIHRGQPPSVRQAWICGYFHIPGWKNESCFSLCNRRLWIRKGVFLFSYIVNCDNGGPYCPSRTVQMNNGVLSVVHTSLLDITCIWVQRGVRRGKQNPVSAMCRLWHERVGNKRCSWETPFQLDMFYPCWAAPASTNALDVYMSFANLHVTLAFQQLM